MLYRERITVLLFAACLPLLAVDRNITSNGAACNGTTNDTAAVQKTIDAAQAGDRVVLSAGCMAAIGTANQAKAPGLRLVSKNNVQIVGLGASAGFRSLAMDYNQSMSGISWTVMLLIQQCTSCRVDGLEFDMEFHRAAAIGMNGNTGTVINNNFIHDVGTGGTVNPDDKAPSAMLQAASNTNCTYSNNRLEHARGNVNVIADGSRGMWVGNNGRMRSERR